MIVAVVSVSESNVLTSPLFSLTNTRPSAANTALVGEESPLITAVSVKPVGTAAAASVGTVSSTRPLATTPAATATAIATVLGRTKPRRMPTGPQF